MIQLRRILELTPRRIAGGYAVFGIFWILLSDQLVFSIFGTDATSRLLQTIKGWVFVALSAALILGLTRVREQQLAASEQRAIRAGQQLQVLHRIFRHNVRNDMTVIRGFASLIRERNTEAEFDPWLREVSETARDVIGMSEKLQIVNDVDIGEAQDKPVDMVSVLEAELERFETRYPEVTVKTELPDQLFVSAGWTIQYVIREALQNAMDHHTDPPADRRITITAEKKISDVTIEISDNGPGIPEDEIAPIESGTESPLSHGSGVGLWIISWLCRSFDGSVRFETDDGTTVSFTLERAAPFEQVTGRVQHELYATSGQ